ncbi:MAG: Na(+)/H(+) antiporter subunit B [Tagaea sp.]|nr:Na(+)/H(+) antiporter subunit B [Tagaea sp.]
MNASTILRVSAPMLLWLPVAVSLYVVVRGHNEPGGGFIGGLLAAAGVLFYAIARGAPAARAKIRLSPVSICAIGLAIAAGSGLPAFFEPGRDYLAHVWWLADIGVVPPLGTALVFDFGVYVTVFGTVCALFLALVEESA